MPKPAPREFAIANGIVACGDSFYTEPMPLKSHHEVTVEWGDCDPAGIVYYPSYFRWCDQATYRLFEAGTIGDGTRRRVQRGLDLEDAGLGDDI